MKRSALVARIILLQPSRCLVCSSNPSKGRWAFFLGVRTTVLITGGFSSSTKNRQLEPCSLQPHRKPTAQLMPSAASFSVCPGQSLLRRPGVLHLSSTQATLHMLAAQAWANTWLCTIGWAETQVSTLLSATTYFVSNDFIWKREHSLKEVIEISKQSDFSLWNAV